MRKEEFEAKYPTLHKALSIMGASQPPATLREEIFPGPERWLEEMEETASTLSEDELRLVMIGEETEREEFYAVTKIYTPRFYPRIMRLNSWAYWIFEECWNNTFVLGPFSAGVYEQMKKKRR